MIHYLDINHHQVVLKHLVVELSDDAQALIVAHLIRVQVAARLHHQVGLVRPEATPIQVHSRQHHQKMTNLQLGSKRRNTLWKWILLLKQNIIVSLRK